MVNAGLIHQYICSLITSPVGVDSEPYRASNECIFLLEKFNNKNYLILSKEYRTSRRAEMTLEY